MSWSFSFCGTIDAVKKAVVEQCDKSAASYAGTPEEKDVLAVKERILALIDALDTAPPWNAVSVTAGGSHSSSSGKLFSANFKVEVTRMSLTL